MKKYKFDLILPVYNVSDYIERCINSILCQSYDNYNVIVVDDGSTDNSIDLVKKFHSKKINIYHKKNGGLSDARNFGVTKTTGDYIWFIDSDDYIREDALEKINKKLNESELDLLLINYYEDIDGKIKEVNNKFGGNNDLSDILVYPSAWSKIFKRDYYLKNKYSFPKGKIYEDLAITPFIIANCKKYDLLKENLYYYVIRKNSIMHSSVFKENRDDKFWVIEHLLSLFKKNNIYDKYKEELDFIIIQHLLIVYSTEILKYSRKIYFNRCKKVLKILKDYDVDYKNNKYIKEKGLFSKIYITLFRFRLWFLCKLIVILANY